MSALIAAQAAASAPLTTICGQPVPAPAALPPDGSPPVLLGIALCFERQGGVSVVEPGTYLHYVRVRPSEPSAGRWVPYDDAVERTAVADFRRLWDTRFLDDLSIELIRHPLPNGVEAVFMVFHLDERPRVRIVEYTGAGRVSASDIEEALKEKDITIRLDSFLDPSVLPRVSTVIRELYAEKGYQFTEVTPSVTPLPGGPKLIRLAFDVAEGPKVAIRDVEFIGNREVSDEALAKAMKDNRAQGLLSLVTGRGVYRSDRIEDDAERVVAAYRDRGYIEARVGEPELRVLDDSEDGQTRWVQLRVPIEEGRQHLVGEVTFDGNTKLSSGVLASMFELRKGKPYSEEAIRKGFEKAREVYGAGGYYEFTAYPDLTPRSVPPAAGPCLPAVLSAAASAQADASAKAGAPPCDEDLPFVDVTIRIREGQQYFVHRIAFAGNTVTRDEVIRRELSLREAAVFNTEALKQSVRRLNQLGYFKPLEDEAIAVEKTPDADNQVDVTLTVEEQNRNQLTFGAGASQYDGVYGTASFVTSNFLGRGESLSVGLQAGARSSFYQVALTEPYVFGRPITAGIDLYSRKIDYAVVSNTVDYSEVRTGASLTAGYRPWRFTKWYTTYRYEVIDAAVSDALLASGTATTGSGLSIALLGEGRHVQSSLQPVLVHDTVDNPYMPRSGTRLTGSLQYAGTFLGGTADFVRPELEAVLYIPTTRRTALGLRGQAGWIRPFSGSRTLPYYLRFFLGGETQIRGVDIRTVGPMDSNSVPLGGDKFVLFNAEYYLDVVPNLVRALLFHDAGQAFDERSAINLRELRTSSGVELRVQMPVLNVPFRLIYAWNVYRDAFQPARTFRFAVGTTF